MEFNPTESSPTESMPKETRSQKRTGNSEAEKLRRAHRNSLRQPVPGRPGRVVPMPVKMTPRKQKFADEYLIDLDGTKAAIRAGYSPKGADSKARECLQTPAVRDYIEAELAKHRSERIATVGEVLEYLTSILRGQEHEEVTVVEGHGQGISMARNITKALSPKDRLKAAELLGKRYCLFADKVKVTGKDDGPVAVEVAAEVNLAALDIDQKKVLHGLLAEITSKNLSDQAQEPTTT